jgi:hypothetical protein
MSHPSQADSDQIPSNDLEEVDLDDLQEALADLGEWVGLDEDEIEMLMDLMVDLGYLVDMENE